MELYEATCLPKGGRREVPVGEASTPALRAGLADLAGILSMEPPTGVPQNARKLAARLRADDDFARMVWAHPMYLALLTWVSEHHPDDAAAWEDMAVYALSRVDLCQDSELTAANLRAGMLGTAAWVHYRGRDLERLDRPEPSIESMDVIDESFLEATVDGNLTRPSSPVEYLADALGGDMSDSAGEVLDEAWRIAHDHYVWLADLTGLRGEELLAAGQSRVEVNRHRRLARRLPLEWPAATRKAVVHILAGTPRHSGLLSWWATRPASEVPTSVRSRWRGLVAVIDPSVGRLADADRRILRERAQRWRPAPELDCDPGIAV
jgi:hypothetical protein